MNIKQNLKNQSLLFRSEIGIWFEKICRSKVIKISNQCQYVLKISNQCQYVPLKWRPFSLKFETIFGKKPLKIDKKCFLFQLKSSFRSQDICLSWLFGHVEKMVWLEREGLLFKIYGITIWLTNNYNTHIAQYLTKQKQPDNKI